MPKTKDQYLDQIAGAGVVAVIRAKSKDQLVGITEALLAGGVPAIEVTMSTPDAIAGIEMLAGRFGDRAVIGVGTVTDAATAESAIKAGAQFVVSPVFDAQVVATAQKYGRIVIPGALTPTEIMRAWSAGADVVKIFPSTALGPQYFKDLLAPLPQLRLTPTGGVTVKNSGDWIKAGAVFVGAGSSLVTKDALAANDWTSITANAKAFVEAIRAARAK
ncbi:MAG TPA: bifunctional 4-hydroxy-2-oxoglutarate aldolase/2-dehydro-3-deoxy-phosphogluconate aldolase [Tepidisphaeraceae bacterium]|jgi:2-dehydro-3-deoxyphosphogluconate aldolase/(4S)-4-hydroxy-2-oxoglutarate aldolase|nr:bifunctional 4-hydroxy-2-oxoglutarate aldolase/2-dehydro-3-deoxy-phosphogluconate aldolase [Tepidisphaeraceae bacterium]